MYLELIIIIILVYITKVMYFYIFKMYIFTILFNYKISDNIEYIKSVKKKKIVF